MVLAWVEEGILVWGVLLDLYECRVVNGGVYDQLATGSIMLEELRAVAAV